MTSERQTDTQPSRRSSGRYASQGSLGMTETAVQSSAENPKASQGVCGDGLVVYTDGACHGNPGPGGWAWVVPNGNWSNGADPHTTNQRMELTAVVEALRNLDGPVLVVSDSAYVVNCFRDGWWEGWLRRNWTNSKKAPIANRDLWEPLLELYQRRRNDISFRWVKGHAGNEWNDVADRLAVRAAYSQRPESGFRNY